jgi:hypothetical protein
LHVEIISEIINWKILTAEDTEVAENGANGMSDIEGKAAREAVSEAAAKRVSTLF